MSVNNLLDQVCNDISLAESLRDLTQPVTVFVIRRFIRLRLSAQLLVNRAEMMERGHAAFTYAAHIGRISVFG